MFIKFRKLGAVAIWVAGIAMSMGLAAAAAEPAQILEIKVKQVVFYKSADGKPAGRIARDEIKVPLKIKEISPDGRRFLVTVGGTDLWIPKMVAKTDAAGPEVAVDCQSITKTFATSRGFGDCE